MHPVLLTANQPRSFYRGAGRIAAFRGVPAADDPYYPEDWIGSTTSRFGQAPAGLTTLPDGRLLRAAVEADPVGWLGAEHVRRHGPDTGVLVKLLDAGERLPLHLHPDRAFATSHLASPYGKTEAWVIVEAGPDAAVHLGFRRDVQAAELAGWVAGQRVDTMLAQTHRIPVRVGDAVLCPAGLPHAIGEDILLVELQEPTDFSVLLEWQGFAIDGAAEGHLGLGWELALECVDRRAWTLEQVQALRGVPGGRQLDDPDGDQLARVLPERADAFFLAERIDARPVARFGPAFAIVVVVEGQGVLAFSDVEQPVEVSAGSTVLVPHAAGACRVDGPLTAVRCRTAP
jgi:mannose-6-phosphate isomerase